MQLAPAQKKAQFVLQEHLDKNSHVDVKDVEGNWRLAKIMQRDEKYLTIRFDAWDAKFQEQLHINSVRIAALRRHTEGYTGPQKRTARDFLLKLASMAELKISMEQILTKQPPVYTAYEITQMIRGEFFVMVDSLLTFPCLFKQDELKAVVGFLEYAVNFSVRFTEKCLRMCPEHFEDFINNREAYLTNPYCAQLAALQEVLYYTMIIFTIKGELRNQLYAAYSSVPLPDLEGPLLEHFKSVFLRMQGLSVIKKVFLFKDSNGRGFPCSTRRSSFLIINYFGNKGPHAVQMPSLEPKDYNEVYKLIPMYLEFFPKEETEIAIVEYSVILAIGSTSFDAKLRGINELKGYLEKIRNRDSRNIFKSITQDGVLQILQNSNFLDALIDPRNFNSQIFKRSVPMMRLLSQKKSLSSSHISQIFKLAQNRHESEIILIYNVISEIANFASSDLLDHIFTEILRLKMNELTISLIKEFTIKAIDNLSKQSSFFGFIRKKKCSSKYDYYGANLLWKEIQDQGAFVKKLIPPALDALKTIFMSESFKNVRDIYMAQCLENIQKKKSFGQSMKLLLNILQSFSAQSTLLMGGESRGVVVQRLDKKYHILETASLGLRKCDFPKISYQQSVEYFFEFLEDYNSHLKQGLRVQNLKTLWKINDNQIELLNFLKKPRNMEDKQFKRKLNKRLPIELIKELFTDIFLMGQHMNNFFELSPQVYDTVDQLFVAMHNQLKNIEMNDKNIIRFCNLPLMGIQFYQNILLVNPSNKATTAVLNKAKKRYVQVHLRPKDYNNIPKKIKLWGNFLDRILDLIPRNRQTMLPTLYQFLKELEGKMVRENVAHTNTLEIDVRCENRDKTIRLPRNSTIFKLRKLIIKEYGMDPAINFFLQVCSNRKEVTFFEEEDYSVNAIDLSKIGPSIRVTDIKGKHPHLFALEQFKEEISYKERMYTLLIDMLSQPDVKEELIWDILELLPKNRNVFDKLDNMANQYDAVKWKQFFNQTNLKKLNYKLRMLAELICKPTWVSALKATGGFDQMINKLVSFTKKEFSTADNIKCICVLVETFYNCLNSTGITDKELMHQVNTQKILEKLMEYMMYPAEPNVAFTNCVIRLLLKLVTLNPMFVESFFAKNELIERVLSEGCFVYQQMQNDAFIANFMQLLSVHAPPDYKIKIVECMISNFLQLEILSKQQRCQYYFELLLGCLERFSEEDFNKLTEKSRTDLKNFPEIVFNSGIKENSEKEFNGLIYGALKIKSFLVRKSVGVPIESDPQAVAKDSALVKLLVNSFLFHQSEISTSYVQSKRNTRELYQLLELLFFRNPEDIMSLVQLLKPRLQKAEWRKPSSLDWMLEVERQERKVYCGLRNLRATCYINCLLQQLYMIQPFREAMLKLDTTPYNANLKQNEMYQLQKLFSFLKYSHKGSYNPRQFCEAFKDYEGKSIDVNVQSDVDEFFNAFMEKLENLLKATKSPEIMNNVFRGALSNQLVCQGCPHSSEREEHFLSLGVNIKNKSSLDEALKGFIQGEILDGDNAYYCETCNKKVRTLKRLCIKELPNILIIVLKRFEFNYDTMKKIKVNDYCSFPLDLDMKKFTAGHLKQKPQYMPDDYYQFKLRGVVVHYGSSEAGHYYSYIKDTEVKDEKKQWFEFNDDLISSFNINDLAEETFGGSETFGTELESIKSEKCRNAYLLFYERDSRYNAAQKKTDKMVEIEKLQGSEKSIMDLALQDNNSFEFSNIVFDMAFIQFMKNVIQLQSNIEVYKLGFLYFHTVLLRVRQKDDFVVPFCNILEGLIRKNHEMAEWYINQVTKPFIKQFLLDAPKLIRYIVVGLVKVAITQLAAISDNTIYSLISFVTPVSERKNMTPYARLFYELSLKEREKAMLEKLFYPQRVVSILTSDSSNKFEDLPETQDVSDFGNVSQEKDRDRGYGSFCTISLIESLANFEEVITIEDLQLILSKTTERLSRRNIAKMAIKRFKNSDWQATQVYINKISEKMITGDDRDIKGYLYWFKEFLDFEDDLTQKRTELIVQKHLEVMETCQSTYYPFDNLFNFMIKFATKYPLYKAELKKKLEIPINPTNKYMRMLEVWIYKSGMATKLVYNEDWKAYKSKQMTSLPQTSSYYDEKRQVRQKQFDTIVKQSVIKQKKEPESKPLEILDSDQDIIDWDNLPITTENEPSYNIRTMRSVSKVRTVGRAGLLYRVNVDGNLKWYVGDRDEFDFHNSIF